MRVHGLRFDPCIQYRHLHSERDHCLHSQSHLLQMLKELDNGARPFMEFEKTTVAYIVYHPKEQTDIDVGTRTYWFRDALGNFSPQSVQYIYGNAINRYKAVDPVSMKQWLYTSIDMMIFPTNRRCPRCNSSLKEELRAVPEAKGEK